VRYFKPCSICKYIKPLNLLSTNNSWQITVPTCIATFRDEETPIVVPRKSVCRRRWQNTQLAIIELEVRAKVDSASCRWSKIEVDALRQRVGPEPRNLRQKINDIHKRIQVCINTSFSYKRLSLITVLYN